MRGKHHIIVENKRVRYEFDIKRNITVIRGDSATGKTTLMQMLSLHQSFGDSSGVFLWTDCPIYVLDSVDWRYRVEQAQGYIFFIEECNRFVATQEFAEAIKKADAYFVLISRESLPNLPYSVEEIYGIRVSSHYAGLKKTYNEFYQIYGDWKTIKSDKNSLVITEDSNSGYDFFSSGCNLNVISAQGKTKIEKMIRLNHGKRILVIADGADFGAEMEAIMRLVAEEECVMLYLPESFEWIILKSGLIVDKEIKEILDSPESYIDSQEFFSWEQFFTKLLTDKTNRSYMEYRKKSLNPVYLQEKNRDRMRSVLPDTVQQLLYGHV